MLQKIRTHQESQELHSSKNDPKRLEKFMVSDMAFIDVHKAQDNTT